jgi:hypothetical protein
MEYLIIVPVVYVYTSIVWVFVLIIYNLIFEAFDFGALTTFAWKSAILVGVVTLVIVFIPLGVFASLLVWLVGLMTIFKKDPWECRVLVILIWGSYYVVNFVLDMVLRDTVLSAQ